MFEDFLDLFGLGDGTDDDDFQDMDNGMEMYQPQHMQPNEMEMYQPQHTQPNEMEMYQPQNVAQPMEMYQPVSAGIPVDIDGDGIMDGLAFQTPQDLDGDGIAETLVVESQLDLDGDGLVDTVSTEVYSDPNLDGVADYYSATTVSDFDGDGQADYMITAEDYNGDGVFEASGEYMDTNGDGIMEPIDQYSPVYPENSGNAPAYETFDPSGTDPALVIGDPAGNMENWHWQETGTSCAVASQEFVLEQLTGHEFDEAQLRELAEENGWYDIQGGTPMDDVGNILEHMGLHVEQSMDNTMEDIAHCLENGGQVIVGVDSSELWNGTNDELFGPGMDADHAVQVTGIDLSNPDQPMVVLNDPGAANGGGAMVPVDAFVDAWEDSGCFMVEAYA